MRVTAIDPPATASAVAPNLVVAGDAVLATWLEPTGSSASAGGPASAGAPSAAGTSRASHRLRFARLEADGWARPVTITEGARIVASWADMPSVAMQADGVLVAHWAEQPAAAQGEGYDVVLARSVDGGATWRRIGTPHRDGAAAEHGFVSLVPDGDAVLALWLDGRTPGATALRAARVGAALGMEQIIDERVCDCCSTAAAATPVGPVVVYRDRDADELRDLASARRAGEAWSTPRPVHADGWQIAGCPVNGPAVAAAGSELATAWYTGAGLPRVLVAFSGDAGVTFEPPIEVDAPRGARAPLGRVDVVVDRPGEVLVSWLAAERESGRLLVRRIARDRRRGAEFEVTTVAASRASGAPRMERLGDDAVLAWTDAPARTIRAVRFPRGAVPAASVQPAPAP